MKYVDRSLNVKMSRIILKSSRLKGASFYPSSSKRKTRQTWYACIFNSLKLETPLRSFSSIEGQENNGCNRTKTRNRCHILGLNSTLCTTNKTRGKLSWFDLVLRKLKNNVYCPQSCFTMRGEKKNEPHLATGLLIDCVFLLVSKGFFPLEKIENMWDEHGTQHTDLSIYLF